MFMQFESIEEFNQMAAAMGFVKKPGEYTINVTVQDPKSGVIEINGEPAALTQDEANAAVARAMGNEPAPTEQPDTSPLAQLETPEPKKRTRRTKAEMEAARAAEVQLSSDTETSSSNANVVEQASTPANPFEAGTSNASAATQAILSAPTGQAATLAGIAAMQANPFDPAAATATQLATDSNVQSAAALATNTVTDAASYIEARSLELLTNGEPITPVSHMHKCREFIGKHGQAKYVETFPLATLPMTVATFKPDQCARHQAAMEFAAQSNV